MGRWLSMRSLSATFLPVAICAISLSTVGSESSGIALLHMHDSAPFYKELGELCYDNKRRYALRHGYEFVSHTPSGTEGLWKKENCEEKLEGMIKRDDGFCYISNSAEYKNDNRAATFGKIKLARAACIGRENWWLLWSDADALIVNQTIKLEDIIDDEFDMMITVDWLMINAGVFLMKCNTWFLNFLYMVYDEKSFDHARALDQSSFQWHIDNVKDAKDHIKFVPKWVLNVYPEEYRPGDFLVHLAGKLYEATIEGCTALAHQLNTFSQVDDIKGITAFFSTPYLLNRYSGFCHLLEEDVDRDCKPDSEKRVKLDEPLLKFSFPNRYRHVGLRYYWLKGWKDKYDVPDWNKGRKEYVRTVKGESMGSQSETMDVDSGNSSNGASDAKHSCKTADALKDRHEEL